jgi:hypothetical protein
MGEDEIVRTITVCVLPFALLILKIRDWGTATDGDTESVETT